MNLNDIRIQINALDAELLDLFQKRMNLCRQVAAYKLENHLPIFQPEREIQILDAMESRTESEDLKAGVRAFFTSMIEISKQLQQQLIAEKDPEPIFAEPNFEAAEKIGCQGCAGSNSEAAAAIFFPDKQPIFYPSFHDIFESVESGEISYGVLPIYNSTAGSVTQVYDLMGKYNFFIAGMNQVEVSHCLAARKGVKLEDVTCVYSHPQAIAQCNEFLRQNDLTTENYSNTATAARFVANSTDKPYAAICSAHCAEINGLEVLAANISDVSPNSTRFICITKQMEVSPKADIISVMLTLPNVPGSLSNLLTKFFLKNIDLVKIESRPIRDGSFDVAFYLDFKGNLLDRSIAGFMTELCKSCKDFKLLGNAVSF